MKTFRPDPDLQAKLRRTAAATGERGGIVPNSSGCDIFDDVLGAVHGGGKRARRTGDAFTEALADSERRAR